MTQQHQNSRSINNNLPQTPGALHVFPPKICAPDPLQTIQSRYHSTPLLFLLIMEQIQIQLLTKYGVVFFALTLEQTVFFQVFNEKEVLNGNEMLRSIHQQEAARRSRHGAALNLTPASQLLVFFVAIGNSVMECVQNGCEFSSI